MRNLENELTTLCVRCGVPPERMSLTGAKVDAGLDGVKLTVEDDAVREIAQTAIRLKTGARGLRTIIEGVMMDTMYDLPSIEGVQKCIITEESVLGREKPQLIRAPIETVLPLEGGQAEPEGA